MGFQVAETFNIYISYRRCPKVFTAVGKSFRALTGLSMCRFLTGWLQYNSIQVYPKDLWMSNFLNFFLNKQILNLLLLQFSAQVFLTFQLKRHIF